MGWHVDSWLAWNICTYSKGLLHFQRVWQLYLWVEFCVVCSRCLFCSERSGGTCGSQGEVLRTVCDYVVFSRCLIAVPTVTLAAIRHRENRILCCIFTVSGYSEFVTSTVRLYLSIEFCVVFSRCPVTASVPAVPVDRILCCIFTVSGCICA